MGLAQALSVEQLANAPPAALRPYAQLLPHPGTQVAVHMCVGVSCVCLLSTVLPANFCESAAACCSCRLQQCRPARFYGGALCTTSMRGPRRINSCAGHLYANLAHGDMFLHAY